MGDVQSEGDGPRCGRRVRTLFVQYSAGNTRLMKCDSCKAVADPYTECEFMIILIDLILHKTRAHRHLLFNKLNIGSSVDKVWKMSAGERRAEECAAAGLGCALQVAFWRWLALAAGVGRSRMRKKTDMEHLTGLLSCILPLTHNIFFGGNRGDGVSSTSIFSTVFYCSEVVVSAPLGNITFMIMLFLGAWFILKQAFNITRYRDILFAMIISNYFKLFLLTMMVWEFPSSVIFIIEMFVLSSNVIALRVSESPLFHGLLHGTWSKISGRKMDGWDAMSLNPSKSSSCSNLKHSPNQWTDQYTNLSCFLFV